ncbi:MAG TPA: Ig-like domain-containing protein [Casimicrobiaceae bacterium]
MRRQTPTIGSQPATRNRTPGLAGDLRWLLLVTLAIIVSSLLSGPAAGAGPLRDSGARIVAAQGSPHSAYASGHILVGSRASSDDAVFEKALVKGGAHSLGKIAQRVHVVDVAPGDEEAAVARLRADPSVEFAEVDRLIPAAGVTNDPMSGNEWHLATVGAPTAWTYSTGAGITIAILDTGVDGTHPDLAANMVPGWNFYDNNSDTHDVNGHGTTVAGAAAAVTNNSVGVASIAGSAKIMPIRIADPTAYALWSTVAQGITYAADHGARVVNLSYEGASASSTIQQAASYLRSKGGVLFVAAGNTGAVDNTPPTDLMMVVAATLQDDSHASWSTYGSFVDISAPGYNIISTAPGGAYWYCWGTSLATPIVAGTAALILAKRPDFTPSQVDATLKSTATDLGTPGPDVYFGAGRVNAAAALQQAAGAAPPSPSDTTKPSVAIASPTGGTVSGIVTFGINASDNVGVTRVELRVNGALIATDTAAPWQFGWNSASVANGSVSVTATAYDAAGNSAVSPAVTLNVSNATIAPADTTPPSVAIASPTGGSVSGSVKVSVNASDNVGVTRVDFVVNNAVLASSNVAPYAFTWNTSAYANGSATLAARAYDAAGNVGTSANVVVNVANSTGGPAVSDTTPPVVTISSPLAGSVVSSTITVRASATDNSGAAGITMKLYIDGVLVTSVRGGSLSYKWNPRKLASGTHTITVTATDASGNTGSQVVQVTH